MVKTIVDLLSTIFLIALAAFLVKNASGTSSVIKSSTSGIGSVVKAVTFQG